MQIVMNHFSDLHFYSGTDLNEMEILKEKLLMSSPEYIFFTGDLLNSNDEQNNKKIQYLLKWLEEVSTEAKLFIVKGNHDIMNRCESNTGWKYGFDSSFWNELSSINNIFYLPKEKIYVDEFIYVFGIDLPSEYYKSSSKEKRLELLAQILENNRCFLSGLSNDKLKIFMCHTSRLLITDNLLDYLKEFNLILSGHEHNGMVPKFLDSVFPKNRGIVNASCDLFPDNVRGVKKIRYCGNLITYVINGGITKIPPDLNLDMFNFLYPMEFTTIDYDSESKQVMIKKMY